MIRPLLEENWLLAILPELILGIMGMVLILLEAFNSKLRGIFAPLTIITIIVTAIAELTLAGGNYFGGTYQITPITRLFDFTFLLAALLVTMFARDYLSRERIEGGEFYALLLWGTVGMMMMSKGLDLLIVILGLEILSICIFVLVGYNRRSLISNEASLKYFLMGAFATGFILYGTAFFYGATGSTHLTDLAAYMAQPGAMSPLLSVAFILIIGGIGFKLALAPFHAWAPDVYQGAPTPIAAWLSVAPKAATLIALMRILSAVVPVSEAARWTSIIALMAILSMVVGNFVAIAQRDLKRMLAYSGIAHVGYMMIALIAIREDAVAAVTVYALTYVLMNVGAFGVVSLLRKSQNDAQTLDDIAGLGFRRPFYGLALAFCMFSLAGLPPTAGFISKFYIFKVAIDSGNTGVAIIAIITSIVSVYYYLRVVYYLYMKEATDSTPETAGGVFAAGALVISMIGIIVIGLFPTPLFETALRAATGLLNNQ